MTRWSSLAEAHTGGLELVRRHTGRFLDMVDLLTDEELSRSVPGLDWTAAETVLHVRAVYGRYTSDLRRAPTRRELAEQNTADIVGQPLDRAEVRTFVEAQLDFLGSVVDQIPPEQQFPFHAGQLVTLAAGWGNLLGELLAHGDDVARAAGRTFAVPGEDLEVLWRYTVAALQGWLRGEYHAVSETWLLRFPFGEGRLSLDGGRLGWTFDATEPADHTLTVDDAAEFTLAFPYRRRAISDPGLALLASRFHDL